MPMPMRVTDMDLWWAQQPALARYMQARFSGVMPRYERPPSWVDPPPEEVGGGYDANPDLWMYNLPRIRESADPLIARGWPQNPRIPMAPPNAGSRTPIYDPGQLDYDGVYPWTHQNAPWRRPQGL